MPTFTTMTGMTADNANETALLENFYACFAKRDHRGMAACYHPNASFQDPVFNLKGKSVPAMWHMLTEAGQDMRIDASGLQASQGKGKAHWVAQYIFSATGRAVENRIDSEFRFRDGRIFSQRDRFSFWRWSRQALGWPGFFLGWMPRLQQNVQIKAKGNLQAFIKAHPEYAEPAGG